MCVVQSRAQGAVDAAELLAAQDSAFFAASPSSRDTGSAVSLQTPPSATITPVPTTAVTVAVATSGGGDGAEAADVYVASGTVDADDDYIMTDGVDDAEPFATAHGAATTTVSLEGPPQVAADDGGVGNLHLDATDAQIMFPNDESPRGEARGCEAAAATTMDGASGASTARTTPTTASSTPTPVADGAVDTASRAAVGGTLAPPAASAPAGEVATLPPSSDKAVPAQATNSAVDGNGAHAEPSPDTEAGRGAALSPKEVKDRLKAILRRERILLWEPPYTGANNTSLITPVVVARFMPELPGVPYDVAAVALEELRSKAVKRMLKRQGMHKTLADAADDDATEA